MTLILVLPTTEGIVMASDGQVTAGMVRASGEKIFQLNQRCLWAASGELALIQRVQERLVTLPDKPLHQLRNEICQIINQCVTELLQLDFRTQFLPKEPNALLQLHPGDFVFAEYQSTPYILHILVNGTAEWITDRPFASGSGDLFAYALLQKYQPYLKQLGLDKASLLAYKVIEETIKVGAYGLGPPIHIWHIKAGNVEKLTDENIAALRDAAQELRALEIRLLISGKEEPAHVG